MNIVETYLDLLDSQRETAFNALNGISDSQLWQPPAPKEWSIGQLLNHNYLLVASTIPYVKVAWKYLHKRGERNRSRPYQTEIGDVYREPKFPMWVGFLWKPKYSAKKPVTFEKLKDEIRTLHSDVRTFYFGKAKDVLGNVYIYQQRRNPRNSRGQGPLLHCPAGAGQHGQQWGNKAHILASSRTSL